MISKMYFNTKSGYIISCILTWFVVAISAVLYNYYIYFYPHTVIFRFVFKPIPVTVMIINVIVYILLTTKNLYNLLVLLFLCFSLAGDIGLMFYLPELHMKEYNDISVFVLGGISFVIGRFIMCINMLIPPFKNVNRYNLTIFRFVIATFITFIYTGTMITYLSAHMIDITMLWLLSGYVVVMAIQLGLTIARVNAYKYPIHYLKSENLHSTLITLFGTICYTISDSLLFINMFIMPIKYNDAISMSFYWTGLYFITVSIHRYYIYL